MDNRDKEIRMEIHDFEEMLRKANVIKQDEYVNTIHLEPDEIIIAVVKE